MDFSLAWPKSSPKALLLTTIQAVCEGRCVEIPMPPELYAQLDEAGNLDLETEGFLEAVK